MKILRIIAALTMAAAITFTGLISGCGTDEMTNDETARTRAGIPPIDLEKHGIVATATFGLGWFWGPDAQFGLKKGVISTRVGYSGGEKENPTYHSLGNHSETVQVDYDPDVISYKELLDVFWTSHRPAVKSYSCQYKSVIFYHNEEQQRLALQSKEQQEQEQGVVMYTEIVPYDTFWLAEDYHQKYYLQGDRTLRDELRAIYPDMKDFIDSTAVARVNGYLGYEGNMEQLQEEIDSLGLSESARERLLRTVPASSGTYAN